MVCPVALVKVAADQPVGMAQQVAVEGGRDTGGVVVGGFQHLHRLDQVDADEQRAVRAQQGAHALQQQKRLGRIKVADGRAGVEHQPALQWQVGRQGQVGRQVGGQRLHLDCRTLRLQLLGPGLQAVHRDVERHKALGRQQRAQLAGLGAVAGAPFDHRAHRADLLRHGAAVGGHDLLLGARRVVLGQLRDVAKQLRAARVVKILGRDAGRRGQQPGHQVAIGAAVHGGRSGVGGRKLCAVAGHEHGCVL